MRPWLPWVEPSLVITLMAACSFGIALAARRQPRPPPRIVAIWAIVAALAAGSVTYRLIVVPPAFVHAEFYGPQLVADILELAMPPHHPYGASSYVLLHGLSWIFGRSAEGIVRANVVLAGIATFPFAWLVARWAGDARVAVLGAAIWACSPLVERLACSEEAHVTGALFALLAALAADIVATRPSRLASVLALLFAQLTVFSRQSFLAWVPFLVLLSVDRDPSRGRWQRARLPLAMAATLCLAVLFQRATRVEEGYAPFLLIMARVIDLRAIVSCIAVHPALAARQLSVVVPPLGALGCLVLARDKHRRVAFFVGLGAATLTSLMVQWPAIGVSYGFRLPQYVLWLGAASIGAGALARALEPWLSPRGAIGAVALLCVFTSASSARAQQNRTRDSLFDEYVWVRDELSRLPDAPVVSFGAGPMGPRYNTPQEVARTLHRGVTWADSCGAYVVEGLGCYAYTVAELTFPGKVSEPESIALMLGSQSFLRRFVFDASTSYGLSLVQVPTDMRPECGREIVGAHEVTEGAPLPTQTSAPLAVWGRTAVTPRLWMTGACPLLPSAARRDDLCNERVLAWAKAASERAGSSILAASCVLGTVRLQVAGAGCDYAVTRGEGFARTPDGAFGVSPIVNLDWDTAPDAMKRGLAGVLGALAEDPSLPTR
jgi:hypothetical protein